MSKQCPCGSFAINPYKRGRDASNNDLCDVCYWKDRAEKAEQQAAQYKETLLAVNKLLIGIKKRNQDSYISDFNEFIDSNDRNLAIKLINTALGGEVNEMAA